MSDGLHSVQKCLEIFCKCLSSESSNWIVETYFDQKEKSGSQDCIHVNYKLLIHFRKIFLINLVFLQHAYLIMVEMDLCPPSRLEEGAAFTVNQAFNYFYGSPLEVIYWCLWVIGFGAESAYRECLFLGAFSWTLEKGNYFLILFKERKHGSEWTQWLRGMKGSERRWRAWQLCAAHLCDHIMDLHILGID